MRLARAGTLFSPAADVLAGTCLVGLESWGLSSIRILVASVLLYAAGMILNDHADREQDATTRPERPIPAGQISPSFAWILGVACLVGCIATSPIRTYHGAMILLVLGYDYILKSSTPLGAVTMGCLRGMNLLSPAVFAGSELGQLIVPSAVYAIYIVSVTLLGALEDAPRVQRRVVLGLISIPPLSASLAIYAQPSPWPAAGIAFGLSAVFLLWGRQQVWKTETMRAAMTWLLLGTMIYTGLLAMSHDRLFEALIILAAIMPARLIARRISLT